MSHVMPDFTDRLERQLRSAALAGAGRPTRRARRARATALRVPVARARLAVAGAVCLAVALTALLVSGLSDRSTPRAYGQLLLLRTQTVPAPPRFAQSFLARQQLGPHPRFDRAYPIRAFGGTAYVVSGDDGWCISAPDPALRDPDSAPGIGCSSAVRFRRYGISLLVGQSFIAALPQGVRSPTVQRPGDTPEELLPSSQGVVTAENLPAGTVLTIFSTDGGRYLMRVRR